MALAKPHMLSFIFIVFISFDLCYCSFFPFDNNDNYKPPFPSLSLTTSTTKDIDLEFNNMINLRARKLAASVQTVLNVVDFGARGDGKDDTLVR